MDSSRVGSEEVPDLCRLQCTGTGVRELGGGLASFSWQRSGRLDLRFPAAPRDDPIVEVRLANVVLFVLPAPS